MLSEAQAKSAGPEASRMIADALEGAMGGLGVDGHTCSLFNAADLARARGRYALPVQRPDGMSAVSVTPEFLATVAEPVFVVAGADKRDAVRALLARSPDLTAWRAVAGQPGPLTLAAQPSAEVELRPQGRLQDRLATRLGDLIR